MSATNSLEASILNLLLNNANIANIGDATGVRGAATAGSLFLSLHTADPGEAGDQTTNEIAYTSYARVAVARSGSGWTVSGTNPTTAALVAQASFPACTGGSGVATHFGIGTASSGAGVLLFKGALSPTISVATGVTPILTTGLQVTAD
jgi:hypothetical protein